MKYRPQNPAVTGKRGMRRGSALVLVVVLVVLLAMMGIGFLFSMRSARVQAASAGNAALPQGSWPAVNEADYTNAVATVLTDVQTKVTQGVLNGSPAVYLNPTSAEAKYTAPKDSLYLADRYPIPEFDSTHLAADLPLIRWGFVTAAPAAAARDTTSGTANQDVYISQWLTLYPQSGAWVPMADGTTAYPAWVQAGLSSRTRVFPAFTTSANKAYAPSVDPADNARKNFAADADGDGIPDSVLTQLPNTATLVGAPAPNTVRFWRAVRVIDNNAAINLNTAWRSTTDLYFDTGSNSWVDIPPTNELYGYLGAFRSNVGLRELLAGGATDNTAILGAANADAFDFYQIEQFRHAGATTTLQDVYTGADGAATGTIFPGYRHLTMGDSIEHGLSRRYQHPPLGVKTAFYSANDRFGTFEERTHDQLAYHFMMANRDFASSQLITRMSLTSRVYAPNTSNNMVVPQAQFFGANQADFWCYTNLATDDTATESRSSFFTANSSPNYPLHSAFTLGNVLKTPRPHLVGENGVTVSTPSVDAPTLVTTSTDPTQWDTVMADYTDSPRKAWVNGAKFGELWRAYYDLFKSTPAAPVQTSRFDMGAAALPGWGAANQLILRSAIAAVNTMQARLAPTGDAVVRTVTIGAAPGTAVKVFGAKRQPFISEVLVEADMRDPTAPYDATTNPVEIKWVAIELHNPYNAAISLDREDIYRMNALTWNRGATLAGQGTIPAAGFKTVAFVRTTYNATGSPVDGMTPLPGSDAFLDNFTTSTSMRLMAWDGTTAQTTNGYDMIPQDEVDIRGVSLGTEPHRFRYSRPTVDTNGSRFTCVYNANNVNFTSYSKPGGVWDAASVGTLGAENPSVGNELLIQVGNYSAFKPAGVTDSVFPYQGFARDGDILHVAYIGNYAYIANPASPYACSVGRDSFWAEDNDGGADNVTEPVGRFIPLSAMTMGGGAPAAYDWAARVFDFVTAQQHPGSEYTPDVSTAAEQLSYTGRSVQGKLNINDAGWEDLAALPLMPMNPNVPAIDTVDKAHAETVKLAKAIVAYRIANGPFTSIFDLNKVTDFAWKTAGVANTNELTTQDLNIACVAGTHGYGDISPLDNAIGDFEQRLDGLTRISNLITTRSDSFTVYILVQAWLDGTDPRYPVLVGERRGMYIMDRTPLTKTTATFMPYLMLEKP